MKLHPEYREWLGQFDLTSEALSLKIRHIEHVVGFASKIAELRGMSKEDVALATIVAQHHDDGRFPQWTVFHTFTDGKICEDGKSHPHAILSLVVLFAQGRFKKYYPKLTDEEYQIVYDAIKRHGDLALETSGMSERKLIHCQIIRDADIMDNLINVKLSETVESLMKIQGFTLDQLWSSEVTQEVFDCFCSRKAINYGIVKTPADWWLTWCAYIFNLSLPESLKIVRGEECIEKIFGRLSGFTNQRTIICFKKAQQVAENYINKMM